jgi:dienelactone hydrolase
LATKAVELGLAFIITSALAAACSGTSNQGGEKNQGLESGGSGNAFGAGGIAGAGNSFSSSGGFPTTSSGGFPTTSSGGFPTMSSGGFPTNTGGDQGSTGGDQGSTGGDQGSTGGDQGSTGGVQGGTGGSVDGGGGSSGGGSGPAPTSTSTSTKGTCTVMTYTTGIATAADYTTPTVYYPTDCPAPFAGVVIIPGFTEVQAQINQWGTFLASHGFAVMMIDSAANGTANTGVEPASRALGLAEGVTNLKAENTRSGSPLMGKLNTSLMAIMGHSMGGGGTLIAANTHPELKAAIGLCPWNPGGTYPTDTVPTLFFDGNADVLVGSSQSSAEYMSIPTTTKKAYAEFSGGSHFVANTPLGGAATDVVVARIGLSWLEVQVLGDTRYQQFIAKDSTMDSWDVKP